jgi:hypothetical protein
MKKKHKKNSISAHTGIQKIPKQNIQKLPKYNLEKLPKKSLKINKIG